MFMKSLRILAALTFPALAGCAAALPPQELLNAREAFSRASSSPAARYNPADLAAARQALDRAELAFADDPGDSKTRDLAYLAEVKSLTAEARGRNVENEQAHDTAEAQYKAMAGSKLDAKNAALANDAARIQATGMALIAEQHRRSDVEKRLHDAMSRLTALAMVKEEPRGTVITILGNVLFASDKSELLAGAAERLNAVADALVAEPERSVTIFGFTDSKGDFSYNQSLSERRAEAVRAYLISRGAKADQLKAIGKGPAEPVADNQTAEGRANNRRVEIVIAPAKESSDFYSP
jgi:outer membrane protein OmpA-like peptidoglycan-associated protein